MFSCEKCPFFTHDSTTFARHVSRKTPCDAQPKAEKPLAGPKKSAQGPKAPAAAGAGVELECAECSKAFSTRYGLARHVEGGRCKRAAALECPVCGERFNNKHAKYDHKRHTRCAGSPVGSQERASASAQAQAQAQAPPGDRGGITTNITNNIITNNHTVVNNRITLSFGSEETGMIECVKFMRYLAQFQGPERIIPAAKAMYKNPRYPQNHDIIRQKSMKRSSVLVRGKDGEYTARLIHAVFDEFRKRILPLIVQDGNAVESIEEKFRRNPAIKYALTKDMFDLVGQATIDEGLLARDYHEKRFLESLGPPDGGGGAFEWPSDALRRRGLLRRLGRHVVYAGGENNMFGIAALYREACGGGRLPAGAVLRELDNGLDDRWWVARAWNGVAWAPIKPRSPVRAGDTRSHFFACMAVDICDALVAYSETDAVLRANSADRVDAVRRARGRLAAGLDHAEYARALSR